MATNGITLRLGQTIGPLLMAAFVSSLGLSGAYLTSSALAVAAFLIVLLTVR